MTSKFSPQSYENWYGNFLTLMVLSTFLAFPKRLFLDVVPMRPR